MKDAGRTQKEEKRLMGVCVNKHAHERVDYVQLLVRNAQH